MNKDFTMRHRNGVLETKKVEHSLKKWSPENEDSIEALQSRNAPYKEMFVMKNATHGLLESRSEEFSEIVHKIAGK